MKSEQLAHPIRRTTTGSIPIMRESMGSDLLGLDPMTLRNTRMRNIIDRKQILDDEYEQELNSN